MILRWSRTKKTNIIELGYFFFVFFDCWSLSKVYQIRGNTVHTQIVRTIILHTTGSTGRGKILTVTPTRYRGFSRRFSMSYPDQIIMRASKVCILLVVTVSRVS